MDRWQKLEVISKALGAIFIPLAVAYLANQVAVSNKQRDSETKFVELATAILNREPKEPRSNQAAENTDLRKWAVDVINLYSGVRMSAKTEKALIQNTASFPRVAVAASVAAAQDLEGPWGVVFGGDTTLAAAKHEVTTTAENMGIGPGEVFRRAGMFRSVKVFVSRSEAEDALGKARVVRPSSYVVNMSTWCPTSDSKQGYFECGAR